MKSFAVVAAAIAFGSTGVLSSACILRTPSVSPVETPVQTPNPPVELPVETPNPPVETPAETPVEAPVETPVETPVQTPVQTPDPVDPVEPPVEPPAPRPLIVNGGFDDYPTRADPWIISPAVAFPIATTNTRSPNNKLSLFLYDPNGDSPHQT
ncbi:hypothetical protein EDB81DRAFT_774368 [Dactylonectria macrodidyma]|uniref:Uncharacterized protein n=1 Tax=Dactylonectria macrodidyma TaxID=307937 RepID=A0A9P9FQR2_9HYPO|nr:hypothetical protein EDB81DRAFT_774368 [Dactylonectria macrodidyma]